MKPIGTYASGMELLYVLVWLGKTLWNISEYRCLSMIVFHVISWIDIWMEWNEFKNAEWYSCKLSNNINPTMKLLQHISKNTIKENGAKKHTNHRISHSFQRINSIFLHEYMPHHHVHPHNPYQFVPAPLSLWKFKFSTIFISFTIIILSFKKLPDYVGNPYYDITV